jgi:hypothetical protein
MNTFFFSSLSRVLCFANVACAYLGSPDAIALAKQLIQDKVSGNVHYHRLLCVFDFVWMLVPWPFL